MKTISLFTDLPLVSTCEPITEAYLNAGAVPEGELRQALTEALEALYEHSDYEEINADLEDARSEIEARDAEIVSLEADVQTARDRLEEHLQADDKAAEIETLKTKLEEAESDVQKARADLDAYRKVDRDSCAKLDTVRAAMRRVIGDEPTALATVAYWHGEAVLHNAELLTLRRRVAELEAPSARVKTVRALEADVLYWKNKALGTGGAT